MVIPPTIFGAPEGVLFDKKLANTHSIQIPGLIRSALKRKRVGVVGQGQAIWDHVHVVDREPPPYSCVSHHSNWVLPVADLYMLILSNAVNSPNKLTYGREGWYFAENGEHTHKDLGVRLGQVLYDLGAVESPEPVYLTPEEVNAGAPVRHALSSVT